MPAVTTVDAFPKGSQFVLVPDPQFPGEEIPSYLPRFRVEDFAAQCPRCVCSIDAVDPLTALVGASGIFLAMVGCGLFGYGLGRVRRIRARIGGAR